MGQSQPPHMEHSERRTSLRFQDTKVFPLVEGILEIEGGQYWPVHIDNLSLEGALLEMPEWRTTQLTVDREIHVKLTLEEKVIWATGIIQHFQDGSVTPPTTKKIGILFQKLHTKDGKRSNHILGQMVRALDRYHLRRRAVITLSE